MTGILKSSIHEIFKSNPKIKVLCSLWVPQIWSLEKNAYRRVEMAKQFIPMLNDERYLWTLDDRRWELVYVLPDWKQAAEYHLVWRRWRMSKGNSTFVSFTQTNADHFHLKARWWTTLPLIGFWREDVNANYECKQFCEILSSWIRLSGSLPFTDAKIQTSQDLEVIEIAS